MIEFTDLHKSLDGKPILNGVSLAVREGETVALLGPSGAGKSVLLKHAIGLLFPDQGDVVVDGISISRASGAELRKVRRNVGYVFQNSALFDSLTVLENLWLALDDGHGLRSVASCRDEARELVMRVNLDPSVVNLYPSQLSGGMRKRVGIARAIATQPRYLLYDEPTTGLDPVNADNVDELIHELARELGVTSIVVTHDLDTTFDVGDRVALLYEGRIRAEGTPEEILACTDPVVQRFVRRTRVDASVGA